MTLSQLFEGQSAVLERPGPAGMETNIADLAYDTRALHPGAAFFCLQGVCQDGHELAAKAAAQGAAALVVQHSIQLPQNSQIPVVRVENSRLALALCSARFFGQPARQLTLIGVTGTKGKTTTAHMLYAILKAAGRKPGIIGTNGAVWAGKSETLRNTTPESYEVHRLFRQMVDAGCDSVVMEVSSQGLMMDRVSGIHFAVGVFTNLYPDHIGGPGEHKSFEEYRAWKGKLFQRCDVGVVNWDDPNTPALLAGHTCRLVSYGIHTKEADYQARQLELLRDVDVLGVRFILTGLEEMRVQVNMPGEFTVYNALAAVAAARALHLPGESIRYGLRQVQVQGRVELVPVSRKFAVLIDFAHNESAAQSLLTTLRAYHPHRLICLFGCGGDRSPFRRQGMGRVISQLADLLILTEDNSRTEPLENILADIRQGIRQGNSKVRQVEIPDRLDALHYALDQAQPGDLICILGKGHENYRDRGGEKTPFPERKLLLDYAKEKGIQ